MGSKNPTKPFLHHPQLYNGSVGENYTQNHLNYVFELRCNLTKGESYEAHGADGYHMLPPISGGFLWKTSSYCAVKI